MLLHFDFANNIILLCFFLFVLFIDLYFLIPVVIKQTFNPIAELVIPIGIPTKQEKPEIETYQVIAKITISEWSI